MQPVRTPAMPTSVVTGASSGIGRWIALGLAQAGHHLVLIVRDADRGEAVRRFIERAAPGAATELVIVDLASLAQTAAAARGIAARHPRLALLVNNAGVFRARRERTGEGRDLVLAVNHLAPFLLMRELAAALQAGGPSRIVTIGSSTADRARIDPGDLELDRRWTMTGAYGRSKLAVMMATFEIADRLAGSGTVANVVHPGAVATNLVRTPGIIGLSWRLMAPFLRAEPQGADTPLHVALSPLLADVTGAYFKDREPARPNPRATDPALRRRIWDETERLVHSTLDR